tara:strand:+ start:905 stop:2071 length:1167 start_codon:yes stop_codon:yes gene_type:complete
MKNCAYLLLFIFLSSCSSIKRTEKNLYKGNYDKAISISIKKLQKSRNKKTDRQHIILLEEAFQKAVSDDISRLNYLDKENNPQNTKEIFEIYQYLASRQKRIRPLLPLENAIFKIVDYSDLIIQSKNNYSDYVFNTGIQYLTNSNNVLDARAAHGYFSILKRLQPTYQQVDSLLEEAHFKGTDFVHVIIQNRTELVIPKRLETAILDFDTYKLDDFWTEYHSNQEKDIDYTYGIALEIREILISPERINEKEFQRKLEVLDGWDYVYDTNGNVKKDSLGNDIKVDIYKELKARLIVSKQVKSVLVGANVLYRNLKENKNIYKFPISSEFIFENLTATFRGNRGALTEDDVRLMRNAYIEFPSNEQMIFDTSTDLKQKFAAILRRKSFR